MKDVLRSASRPWRAALLVLTACTGLRPPAADETLPRGSDSAQGTPVPWSAALYADPFLVAAPDPDTATPAGVRVELADAGSRESAPRFTTVASPLEPGEAEALLVRLADAPAAIEAPAFRFPTRSMPAPRPGTLARGVFPDPDAAAVEQPPVAAAAGPLRAVHTAPNGEVATTSQVSVVFSRPMTPLAELDSAPRGVRLSPAVLGAWRWLDPYTLVFESAERLPKATRYTVDVPGGLVATDGEPLGEAVNWTFSTPAPILLDVVPADLPGRLAVLALVFDQRVDPAAVLPFLRFEVDGRAFPLRLVTGDERGSSDVAVRLAVRRARTVSSGLDSAQLVMVRPEGRLPAAGGDDVEVEAVIRTLPGLPSLEGPERTAAETVHRFHIAPTFSVVEHGCGRAFTCWPGVPWTIRFNTRLGSRPDSGTWVRVDPPLPGATLQIWNDHLIVLGTPEAGQTYTVWLDPAVASLSGEKLGPTSPLRFSVGRPPASVWMPGGGIALIPATQPALYPILTEGVDSIDIEIRAVTADDWAAYESVLAARPAGFVPALVPVTEFYGSLAPGEPLYREVLSVTPVRGGPDELGIELDAALESTGHVLVIAEPVESRAIGDDDGAGDGNNLDRLRFSWLQRGELQLDVQEDRDALTVYATSAVTGRPLRDVRLELAGSADPFAETSSTLDSARTDEGGLATLKVDHATRGADWLLRAEHGGRSLLFPAMLVGEWSDPDVWAPHLRTHFLMDRPIYEPGDTVRFAGWLRTAAGTGREPVRPDPLSFVEYEAHDPRGATLAQGEIFEMSENGRTEGSFVLPAEVNSGRGWIRLTLSTLEQQKLYHRIWFQIEEARRPNFDVTVEIEPGPVLPGGSVQATTRARYFTGGGVPDAEVRWAVGSRAVSYSPPGISGYRFGRSVPIKRRLSPAEHTARTSGAGEHRINARIESVQPDIAMNLTVEATVVDLDRQQRTAHANVLVHPANVYVGVRIQTPFVRAGEPLEVEVLAVDLEGRAVAGRPITVRGVRQDRRAEAGTLVIDESTRAHCELHSRPDPVRCTLEDLPVGDYLIVARVEDDVGRHSASAVRVAGETIPSSARADRDRVDIELDRTEYEPGDTALVSIDAWFAAVEALLTVRRGGVIDARAVTLENGAAVVPLPIRDAHVPSIHLNVATHAADGGTARQSVFVPVAPRTRELDVSVAPRSAEVAPGAGTTIAVTVKGPDGRLVPGADVVLSGVDEAMVALARRAFPDPLEDIYPRSDPDVFDRTLRTHLVPRLTPTPQITAFDAEEPVGVSTSTPVPGREGISPPQTVPPGSGRTGSIEGVVIAGNNGTPIGRAWVEAAGVGGTWTRPDGSYQLRGLPAGEHVLLARADGFVTRQIPAVTVAPGGSAHAHFVLLTHWDVLAGGRSLTGEPLGLAGGWLALLEANAMAVAPPPGQAAQYRLAFMTRSGSNDVLRHNLSPVAAFVTRAVTGPDGRVEIPVEMPDNLTRYRIRAVAARGDRRFGVGESTVTVRRPLIVRPTPPRFLNQGDHFELPVLLENRSGAALEVDVAVRGANAEIGAPAGRRVSVPPEDRVEVRFPATAGLPGAARFQVAAAPTDRGSDAGPLPPTGGGGEGGRRPAAPGPFADAVEVEVPVLVPAATESFAVYGQLDDATPVGYPIRLPDSSLPGQARVELGFATTAAHGLGDAFWFLVDCPFDLPEVWASRVIALTALRDVPVAAPWPLADIDSAIAANVSRLARLQLRDGGWSLWTARFDADPFVTVHAAHALAKARAAGLDVPERTLADATRWLARIGPLPPDSTSTDAGSASPFPTDYPRQARHAVQSYALDVRRHLGHDVSASAAALLSQAGAETLPAEALAWLLPALAGDPAYTAETAELRRELDARIVRSAGTAGIVSPYETGGRAVFYSPRRTDAVVLAALVESDPSRERGEARRGDYGRATQLVAALARGLMAHRVRGRWSNTQENAFAVAALAGYLMAAEADEPAFRVRAWAGGRLAGEYAFDGRSDERREIEIPADSLGPPGEDLELVIAREGTGRLYYRVGVSYALAGASPAIARGFEVSRVYEAVDDPDDVRRDDDGAWHVRRGARVRVRLTVAAPGPRYHVAVIDPLPAGLEAVNTSLAGTTSAIAPRPGHAAVYTDDAPEGATRNAPFIAEHVNVKADRFEAFKRRLEPGRRDIVYYALATTPGDFAAPAPRAEEMYAPETFGRGAAEQLVVEAPSEAERNRP